MGIGTWISSILHVFRRKEPRLVEIFREHIVEVRSTQRVQGRGGKVYGERDVLYRIMPKENPKTVTVEDLEKYVAKLNMHHPEEGFTLKKVKIRGREMFVITKNSTNSNKPNVPIYFDIKNQKFYIEKESTEEPEIANYIIMRTLGALGVSQSKYLQGRMVKNA